MTPAPTKDVIPYIAPIFQRKPKSVTALKVDGLTSYADMVIIVEGGSRRQVTSLAEHAVKAMKESGITALGLEGVKEGQWALLDYGHIIIHIFESDAKDFYDLEGLWNDAPRIDLSQFNSQTDLESEDDA